MNAEQPRLVADIGGTNARFALARGSAAAGFMLEAIEKLEAKDFARLEDAVWAYLDRCGCADSVGFACFAGAGPVEDGAIQLTNSPWRIDPRSLERALGLARVAVVNDFAAQARGAPLAPADQVSALLPGEPVADAPMVTLGPGTGLGVGLLAPAPPGPPLVIATEGGHAAFAARTDAERRVAERIAAEHGYVSWERVLSGPGLADIDAALGDRATPRTPREVTGAALAGEPEAQAAVELFCTALGGFASDVAVVTGARGGVFLGGGVLPRIEPLLRASGFAKRFRDKGPMSAYVAAIPVTLILTDRVALLGAAAIAERLVG